MSSISLTDKDPSAHLVHFLDDALKGNSYEIIPLAGDASSRRYYRIIFSNHSLVVMDWEPFKDAAHFPFLNILSHFKAHHIRVPEIIKVSPSLGLVLMEDLGDLTLERKFWETQEAHEAIPFYTQALDELIKIHFHASQHQNPACSAFSVVFDTEKLLWELNYGKKHLLEQLAQIHLTSKESTALEQVFLSICTHLDKEPKFIAHRDYHSRNIMIKLGKVCIIDFQDARMGPIQYDLASLLYDSYVDLSDSFREDLLSHYLTEAKSFLPKNFSSEQFLETLQIQRIQRCFKACGSFASFYNMRQDRRYLKYLPATIKQISMTLKQFPQYQDFLSIIEQKGLFERKFDE